MQFTTRCVLAGFAASVVAACEPRPTRDQRTGDTAAAVADSATDDLRAAIARVWADHLAAAKRNDPIGVSAMYANDAVYAVGRTPEVHGRPALDTMEARGLRGATVLDATHTTHAVRRAGDIAYELGTIVGPVRPAGDTARVVTFNFMAQWRREKNGTLRLTYLVGR